MWTVPSRPLISRANDLGPRQHLERAVVAGALAHRLLEPLDGLDVVVEDVGPGLHHGPQRRVLAVEVGDQHLDAHARALAAQRADGLGEDVRAAVGAGRRGRRW